MLVGETVYARSEYSTIRWKVVVKKYIYLFFFILQPSSIKLDLFDGHQSTGFDVTSLEARTESSTTQHERFAPLFALRVKQRILDILKVINV